MQVALSKGKAGPHVAPFIDEVQALQGKLSAACEVLAKGVDAQAVSRPSGPHQGHRGH